MTSISTTSMSGIGPEAPSMDHPDRSRRTNVRIFSALEQAGQGERCSGRRHRRSEPSFLPAPCRTDGAVPGSGACLSGRRASTRCRNSAVSSRSLSGDLTSLMMIASASSLRHGFRSLRKLPARIDDHRQIALLGLVPSSLRSARCRPCRADRGREPCSRSGGCASRPTLLGPDAYRRNLHVVRPRSGRQPPAAAYRVILDDEELPVRTLQELLHVDEGRFQDFRVSRASERQANAPSCSPRSRSAPARR